MLEQHASPFLPIDAVVEDRVELPSATGAESDEHTPEAGKGRAKGAGRVRAPRIVYPPHHSGRTHTWKTRLSYIFNTRGREKVRSGNQASNRTYEQRRESTYNMLTEVRKAGYKLEDPQNLDVRHVQYLLDMWERRWKAGQAGEKEGLSSGTIANYVSTLRTFCGWIGQPQLMEKARFESENVVSRSRAAKEDKSWEGNEIDALHLIERCWEVEPWVAVALLSQYTLGLRRREAVMFRPAVAHRPGENEVAINVVRSDIPGLEHEMSGGSKGGRPRFILLTAPWEHDVLDFVREFVKCHGGRDGYLGGNGNTLRANLERYRTVVVALGLTKAVLGVTGHGLRHEFAIRELHRKGHEAPVRGGDLMALDPKTRKKLQSEVSENMGHGRPQITTSYYGAVNMRGEIKSVDVNPDEVIAPRIAKLLEKFRVLLAEDQKVKRAMLKYLRAHGKA